MSFWQYLVDRRDLLVFQGVQHLSMVAQCLLAATVIALVVAAFVYRNRTAVGLATATSAIGLTVPSFALLGLLVAVTGFGITPAVIALTFYAILPILRNTVVGLAGVDPTLVDSARGMGMGRLRILTRIEFPMAWPVVVAGVRVSGAMIMGIGAIAAYVGGAGLGGEIFSGLSRLGGANALNSTLAGTLGIAALALFLDLVLLGIGRITTSRGIRV
ncbi:MAG: ABC transporter permease [Actinomycetota bacterium]|nr:ABC transporter permease [Actinomycetota bacterium]